MLLYIVVAMIVSLAFGLSDVLSGVVARRIGTVVTATGSVTTGVVLLSLFVWITGRSMPDDPVWTFEVVVLGVIRSVGYIALVQAFNTGPVAVVGPILASTGASSVIFAVLLLHDHLDFLQWLAVPLSTAGAVLCAVTVEAEARSIRVVGKGPLFAVVAVILLGSITVWQQIPIRQGGWAQTVLVRRATELVVTALILVVLYLWRRSRSTKWSLSATGIVRSPDPLSPQRASRVGLSFRTLPILLLVGSFETASIGGLAFGLQIGPAWFIGLVTSVGGAVVAIAFGYLALAERLRKNQWLGIGLVAVGVGLAVVG